MRASSLAMTFGLLLAILFGLQLLASPTLANMIEATIEIRPMVLNLREPPEEITVFIWLPASHSVRDIDVSSVRFDGQPSLPALRGNVAGDKLLVKFDGLLVASYIWTNKVYHMAIIPPQADCKVSLVITGLLHNGDPFQNTQPYMLKVILPPQPGV